MKKKKFPEFVGNNMFYNSFHFSAQLNIYLFDYCCHDLSELWTTKYLGIIYNDSNINIQKRAMYTQSHHRYTEPIRTPPNVIMHMNSQSP